ncbi:class II fructose-bisphosphate aldolase [Georgenia sp. Z1491]|uniref:class II fructose-bisphosphate aldolase n=1 Tax=Georgenia sp. Z1491 TaxID=3416707 RepID=UPI003CF1775B
MTIAKTLDLVRAAREGGYAVPAVNIVDDHSIRAVVDAAESVGSPVILQTSVKTVKLIGAEQLAFAAHAAARNVSVPVSLHLDHCPDRAVITECIRHGWDSVLFDASDRPLETAWAETTEVVAEAHAAGVAVESEIENIIGVEDGVGSDEAVHAYTVDQLIEVAEDTGVDTLAPQLGTAHGLYTASPELRVDRAAELVSKTEVPIVLHGGTGLTEADFHAFIDAGVAKINISTALKLAYMKGAQAHLAECERTGKWEPVKLFAAIAEDVAKVLTEHAEIFRSAGRAA